MLVAFNSHTQQASCQAGQIAETIQNQKAVLAAFNSEVSDIAIARRDPSFSRWTDDLESLVADATRIVRESSAVMSACIRSKTIHSDACDAAATRENFALSGIGAASAFSHKDQVRPWNDAKTIQPQVEEWDRTGFEAARLNIVRSAKNPGSFKSEIDSSEALRQQAAASIRIRDWTAALITLRHSQMLMQDAFIRALQTTDH
jgi:hypothetical protein